MKIFEIREFIDGGPNDRGFVIGYIESESREELRKNRPNGFIDYFEIPRAMYNEYSI